ncbi:tyrosine-type recombinase/integrase [Nocardioides sp. NPDC058538]|uniref:tyrosine-type recombinase/integrase n=1 Tax=Nocardioides sp. NPDC058538 TaxID=3346542 RepID=UPI0036533632
MTQLSAPPSRPTLQKLPSAYAAHLERLPISDHTRRSYGQAVTGFVDWLPFQLKHDYDQVVSDPIAATHAVRDYRRYLLTQRRLAPKSVDAAMTGIANLYLWFGMPRPDVRSAAPSRRPAPQSLEEDQVRDVLRAAERRGVRDHALVNLLHASGVRISEAVELDVDDVPFSERKGVVHVRLGKGEKPRDIPLSGPSSALRALAAWCAYRRDQLGMPDDAGPLFVSRRGERLAERSMRDVVTKVGTAAGVELSPHTLRHTFGRALVDKGADLPTVATLMGHNDVNTTMVYTGPREDHLVAATRLIGIDY